ncbi:hypothetical protein HMSLTHF_30950 [Vreelandella aquamarina]|uniref:Uncharacterized protein n=1 Tax=Vreelandella aquamarina TaxID=77097 RepID=A0A6F8SZJ2_9GAMM|nr:hypothetical protein HMSLTHF_30950 [Halomonas meridiana]
MGVIANGSEAIWFECRRWLEIASSFLLAMTRETWLLDMAHESAWVSSRGLNFYFMPTWVGGFD